MSDQIDKNSEDTSLQDRISVIEIGGVLFGIEILKSKEVFPLPDITPVPNTKEFVIGVFNLRGDIYPLIDISLLLGLTPEPLQKKNMIILLDSNEKTVGVLSDRVHGVRPLKTSAVKPVHGVVSKVMEEYVSGVVSEKGSEIHLLNVDRLLSSPSISRYY